MDINPNHYGILHYSPERIAGETDESIKLHIDNMLDIDMQLPAIRNQGLVKNLMSKTFLERRAMVTRKDNLSTVADMKKLYPLLFSFEGMTEEFQRLMDFAGLKRMEDGLKSMEAKLFLFNKGGNESNLLVVLRELVVNEEDPVRQECKYLHFLQ